MNDELSRDARRSDRDDGPVTQPSAFDAPDAPDTRAPASMFGPPSAGGMIRAARQAQGLDLASLAAMLKVPLRRIEALEQGRHDELQGATFERALAQAACRVLKVDPKPVLALLPQHERNTLEGVSEGLNTPFRERQGGGGFGAGGADLFVLARPVVLLPVLLLVAAAALFYVPSGLFGRWMKPIVASVSGMTADAPNDAASAPAAGATTSTVAVVAPAASAVSPMVPVASLAPPTPAASAPTDGAIVSSAATAAAAPAGADDALEHPAASPGIPVQVIATADSWVEVVDAQGHPLLSRTVVAGESVGLDGALPMRVKVGNARGTRLTLRGDNVDLAPWTRDNVARLELK